MDLVIFQATNQLALRWFWLDTLAIFFAQYFGYILIVCLSFFLIKGFRKYWPMVFQVVLAALLARLVIVEIIRFFWGRSRPFIENNINLLLIHAPTSSFPLGHAAFYFALATMIYFYNKKSGLLFFLAATLISLSRVFAGLHWPSDILVGAIVGIFSGWLIIAVFRRYSLTSLKQEPQER